MRKSRRPAVNEVVIKNVIICSYRQLIFQWEMVASLASKWQTITLIYKLFTECAHKWPK
jgi:hypothetical protein